MKRDGLALLLAGICAASVVCGGCSGAGVPAEQLRGGAVRSLATDHLSAVVLVKSWFAILYQREAQARGCEQVVNYEDLPGGGYHIWGTNTDCSEFDWTVNPDESGTGTQKWPDGKSKTETWGPVVIVGDTNTQTIEDVYSDGTRIAYTVSWAWAPLTPQTWDGAATLADGRAMSFVLNRTDVEDSLTVALPDGSRLQAQLPLTSAPGAAWWPVFSEGASGTFRGASGDQCEFQMNGRGDRWDRWLFTSGDGTEGAFTLGEQLDGAGELRKGGKVIAALRWSPTAAGTLDLTTAQSEEVTPSAAARDFQIDRWVASVAAMGPQPVY